MSDCLAGSHDGRSSPSMISAMARKFSSDRWLKQMISSTRFKNSGRRNSRRAYMEPSFRCSVRVWPKPRPPPFRSEPALEVMTMMVFSKLTRRPYCSVMWCISDFFAACRRRINFKIICQVRFRRQMGKDTLRHGAAADVAVAVFRIIFCR